MPARLVGRRSDRQGTSSRPDRDLCPSAGAQGPAAADGRLKGIVRYTSEPVVSTDVIGESASCLFDSGLTRAVGDLVKIFGWYDNEWGYAQRTVDLVDLMVRTLPHR
jgi:glyceraldehyde-3-phosphate dehydrogenase/erythrose-4-phosphate dehydrogenase